MNFKRGFTLLEFGIIVMIVFVLIGIIFGFLVQARNRAADANIKQLSSQFHSLAEIYFNEHGTYGGHRSFNTFVCDSESACQWSESMIDEEAFFEGFNQFKLLTEEFKRGSWEESGNHRVYFGAFGKSYAAVINMRTAEYWCFDSDGNKGVVDSWPEFDRNRTVSCPETLTP